MAERIPASVVAELVAALDQSRTQAVQLSDLGISKDHVEHFQAFIDREAEKIKKQGFTSFDRDNLYQFPGENADFSFYKSTASNLASLTASQLTSAFGQAYGNWSTTRNWSRVVFVFADGKRLIVENSDDKPTYLYSPWQGDYDGLKFSSTSIRFGQLLDELTEGQFFPATVQDKNYALFTITNYLYKQKLLAEE
ncbi:hypothetical protein MUN84_18845 [Hymenobacter sp. 5516J-16]|uniref:hypothetical protein n=1 Tax=Hymenobacter sp. 5516J-16 TaxID=2932253 RepID=UPI001FCFE9FC|nr:hypothetical protein [Hymenobacter sp. 5516J-16]UOQ76569.1 hypothetical protein MUN84_18845 [Hymenobacter sp. 5516J-16]